MSRPTFLRENKTVSIPGDSSGTVSFPVPGALWGGQKWGIKQIDVDEQGGNITITDILIDGNSIGEIVATNLKDLFGALIYVRESVEVTANNDSGSPEDIQITIYGAPIIDE